MGETDSRRVNFAVVPTRATATPLQQTGHRGPIAALLARIDVRQTRKASKVWQILKETLDKSVLGKNLGRDAASIAGWILFSNHHSAGVKYFLGNIYVLLEQLW